MTRGPEAQGDARSARRERAESSDEDRRAQRERLREDLAAEHEHQQHGEAAVERVVETEARENGRSAGEEGQVDEDAPEEDAYQ